MREEDFLRAVEDSAYTRLLCGVRPGRPWPNPRRLENRGARRAGAEIECLPWRGRAGRLLHRLYPERDRTQWERREDGHPRYREEQNAMWWALRAPRLNWEWERELRARLEQMEREERADG